MKQIVTMFLLLMEVMGYAQIHITPYLPKDFEQNYPSANGVLESKLNSILSANNIKSQMGDSRFILTANITPETKDVVASAPPQIAYTLNISLCIGDGEVGTKYVSEIFRVKGVGATEEKAYLSAVRNLQAKTSQMTQFVNAGKERILEYYETNKNILFEQVNSLMTKGDYEEALYQLCLIPVECSYSNEVSQKINMVHQDLIDRDNQHLFSEAKAIWAATQNEEGANKVINLISEIDPKTSFYPEVQAFIRTVNATINLINERAYATYQKNLEHKREMDKLELEASREKNRLDAEVTQTKIKATAEIEKTRMTTNAMNYAQQQQTQRERNRQSAALASQAMSASERLQSERISAARDVAMTYAQNRPKTVVYNISGW